MSPPPDATGFWRRLLTMVGGGRTPEDPSPPPLFRARPVPDPEPRGPGLPAWDDILTEPPPVTAAMREGVHPDMLRPLALPPGMPPQIELAQPDLVADVAIPESRLETESPIESAVPIASASVPDPVPSPAHPAATDPDAPAAGRRRLTAGERAALADIRSQFTAGEFRLAATLVESAFAGHRDACDRNGLPIYLMESLRCALAMADTETATRFADEIRPMLAPNDPMLEAMAARAASRRRDRAGARAAWLAALDRAPGLPEAMEYLARNQVSPDGGIAAIDLIDGERPKVLPPPALTAPPHAAAGADDPRKLLPPGLPGRLLIDAAVSVSAEGMVDTDAAASSESARPVGADPTALAIVLRHPDGLLRQHAFVEAVLAAFAAQRAFLPHLQPARIYVGRQGWALPGTAKSANLSQAEMLAVLFPGVRVVGDFDGAVREERVLVVDGGMRNAATDTLIGGFMPQVVRRAVEARQRIFAAFGLPDTADPPRVPGRRPRALYLQSAPPRALAEPVRERLFEMLLRAGYDVARVDMATLPWRRQVQLACGADLLVGAHSPAMFSALWAHPQARVLEFFPEGTRRYDGQLLAEAAAVAYLGLEGVAERGFVIRARERWGPPVGKANRLVWALPWPMLEQALATTGPAPGAQPAPAHVPPPVPAESAPAAGSGGPG